MAPLTGSGTCVFIFNCMAGLFKVSSSSSSESADIETSEAESSFPVIEILWALHNDLSKLTLELVFLGEVAIDVSVVDMLVLPEGMSLLGVSISNQVWFLGSFGRTRSREKERIRKLTLVKYFAD